MKIGVHTGPVIAGIIGSRIAKYDIFGEGVLIGNKIKINALENKLCISEDTMQTLLGNPEVANEYYYNEYSSVYVQPYKRDVKIYHIEKKQTESMRGMYSSDSGVNGSQLDESSEAVQEEEMTSRSH